MRDRLQFTRMFALLAFLLAVVAQSCSRHDVGSEANNPAPSSGLTLAEAQGIAQAWAAAAAQRAWSTPTPTSSMVPYLDSRSALLLERVTGPVRIHDILVMNEGPGRENICHQVVDVKGDHVYLDGKNSLWPDGWIPLTAAKWRVAGVIYSKG